MLFMENFAYLFSESAPFLLLGMLLAGLIHQMVPKSLVEQVLGKSSSVVSAAIIGAPLPLCSCSVIPVAMGIRRNGASKASTASFLVATPETGVDSIGVTYALMGPVMAIIRPISAICSAIITGLAVKYFATERASELKATNEGRTCCSAKPKASTSSGIDQLKSALNYGFGQLLRDFMAWLLIGLFFAALIQTFVPSGFVAQYGQGLFAMLLVTVISIPMYICATASTPVAVGLMLSGVSPGAALVFMLAGPATNIATLMVIKNELGKKELVLYLISVVSSALCAGMIVDYLFEVFSWEPSLVHGGHEGMAGWLYKYSALILAGLILFQYTKKLKKRLAAQN